jgi:transposase InsO family protein
MSVGQKVTLVRGVAKEFGVQPALDVLGLARSTWSYQAGRESYAEKYAQLRAPLEQIATVHPEYGYRRVAAELRETLGHPVNGKVVRRLHHLWDLPLRRSTRPPRPSAVRKVIIEAGERANLIADLTQIGVLDVFYTDFTELAYAAGKAHLIVLVDHTSKLVPGWALDDHIGTDVALRAWSMAKRTLRRFGRSPAGCIVHHDQDSVFTSHAWLHQLLVQDQVRVSYSLDGAKQNTEMESFNSRFKNENRSLLLEARTFDELWEVVAQRMRYYNRSRRHSSIGQRAPLVYLREALRRNTER